METRQHRRPPTEKQIKFASAIAERLHICLPWDQTRQSLFLFIRDNRPKFDALRDLEPSLADTDPDPAEAMILDIDLYTGALND